MMYIFSFAHVGHDDDDKQHNLMCQQSCEHFCGLYVDTVYSLQLVLFLLDTNCKL